MLAVRPTGTAAAVSAAGLATGLILVGGLQVIGPAGAFVPAAAAIAAVLLLFPAATVALLVVSVVAIEQSDAGLLPPLNAFYEPVALGVTLPDLLLLIALSGIVLRLATNAERPRLPHPMVVALVVLAIALLAGGVTAYYAGVSLSEILHLASPGLYLILVPVVVVNVVRDTSALRAFAAVAAGLAAYKGVSGLYAAVGGAGLAVDQETISFLDPLANLTMLLFVLGVVAALVQRVPLPTWMLAAAPLAAMALLLSYRRSFWLAAAFAVVLVLIVASRRRGRAVFAIAVLALAATLVGTVTFGGSSGADSPLVERARQLGPSSLTSIRGDRYRVDEQRNVIATLREHPLTGTGIGVPWEVSHPLAESHDRRYAHVAVLSYWLRFGPLGVIAYLGMMGAALFTAVQIWRRHGDAAVRVAAIACFGAIAALLIVELTATFTGVDERISIMLGAGFGWLAAAWRELPTPQGQPARGPV